MARQRRAGALAISPEEAAQRQAVLQRRIDAKGGNAPNLSRRLNRLNNKFGALASDPTMSAGPTLSDVNTSVNEGLMNLLPNVGQTVDLNTLPAMPNPSDYEAMRQKAYDSVMSQFDRTMAPEIARQQQSFEQTMADKGIARGSEAWNREYEAMQNAQNNARQNAMNQAFSAGQAEQAQQFGQALNTRQIGSAEAFQNAQLPMAGINSLGGLFSGQQQMGLQTNQQQFLKELEALKNKYTLGQIAATPRGGGGTELSMADRFALMDRESQNRLALLAAQAGMNIPNQPSATNSAIAGLATGIGAGIAGGLT